MVKRLKYRIIASTIIIPKYTKETIRFENYDYFLYFKKNFIFFSSEINLYQYIKFE